jgi:hypothetical protein
VVPSVCRALPYPVGSGVIPGLKHTHVFVAFTQTSCAAAPAMQESKDYFSTLK